MLTWQRLVYKLERHATWSLTKNHAANSITKFRGRINRLFGKGEEKERKDAAEEDSLASRKALLGL